MKLNIQDFYNHPNVQSREWNDLVLFCYTRECQFDGLWDDVTMAARGIIFNKVTGEVVARPFIKFFNASELDGKTNLYELAKKPFVSLKKLDGCFHAKTPILMPDGTYKKIMDIVNDKSIEHVMGYDHNTGEIKPVRILNRFKHKEKNNWMLVTTTHNWCHTVGSSRRYDLSLMRVTDNHEYFNGSIYKPIREFEIGEEIYAFDPILSDIQKEVFFGSLLGDTSISFCQSKKTAVLQGFHKRDHEEYVRLKKRLLGHLCQNTSYSRISGFGTDMVPYASTSSNYLGDVRKIWYPNNKRKIPEDLSWLTPVSIAFLYMDNGSLAHNEEQNDRALFTMSAFEKGDCERLLEQFKKIFPGIDPVLYYSKGWNIRINYVDGIAISNFWKKISAYFPVCMQYKLPVEYRSGTRSVLETVEIVPAYILRKEYVQSLRYFKNDDAELNNSRTGYDLETESHNYFAKGVLVHNSFAIHFQYEDQDYIATKGSFVSEQAGWATKWFRDHVRSSEMIPGHSYLFEMIYPENKIVVDYGDKEELILLGVINNETGAEIPYQELLETGKRIGVSVVEAVEFKSLDDLYAYCKTLPANEEGFVITFHNGLKVKVKGDEYCKIHRILSHMTPLAFWNAWDLDKADVPKDFRVLMPEEFREVTDLLYKQIYDIHWNVFHDVERKYKEITADFSPDVDHKTLFFKIMDTYPRDSPDLMYFHKKNYKKLWLGIHRRVRPTNNILPGSVAGSDRLKRILEEN